jgi:hypothetical protein
LGGKGGGIGTRCHAGDVLQRVHPLLGQRRLGETLSWQLAGPLTAI